MMGIDSWVLRGPAADCSPWRGGRARNGDATVDVIKPYQLYGANLGVKFNRSEVRLFIDNISDERGPTAANGPTLLAGPRPFTIGIGFRTHLD